MRKELPQGTLLIHAEENKGIINTKQNGGDPISAVTKRLNTPDNLYSTFYDPKNPRVLHNIDFADGSHVRLYNQTGKYSEVSALVIASGPHTFDKRNNDTVPTETIYNYSSAVQETYWQQVFATMNSFTQNTPLEGMRVFAGENCVTTYSNEQHRTSRSIANPHTHIVGFVEDHIDRGEILNKIPRLSEEQSLLEKITPHMTEEISASLPKDLQKQIKLQPRTMLPYGYSFQVHGELDQFVSEPKEFTRIMSEHHLAYTSYTKDFNGKNKEFSIPQPSYRMYLEHDQETLHVTISPEIMSHAGVMEAAGVILNRSVSHPPRIKNEKIKAAQDEAVKSIQIVTFSENRKEHI